MFNTHVHNGHLTYFQQSWNLIKLPTSLKCLLIFNRTEEHNVRINVFCFPTDSPSHASLPVNFSYFSVSQLKRLKAKERQQLCQVNTECFPRHHIESYDYCLGWEGYCCQTTEINVPNVSPLNFTFKSLLTVLFRFFFKQNSIPSLELQWELWISQRNKTKG